MAGVVVAEAVDDGEGTDLRVDASGGDAGGGAPELVLEVGFDGEVIGEVVVYASAGRVDVGGAGEVGDGAGGGEGQEGEVMGPTVKPPL